MTSYIVAAPFPMFTGSDGKPLQNGKIWIGVAGQNPQEYPITVYWDLDLTLPAVQPIRTVGGYPAKDGTPARIYTGASYSITVQNSVGALQFSSLVGLPDPDAGDISRGEVNTFTMATGVTDYALAFNPGTNAMLVFVGALYQRPVTDYTVIAMGSSPSGAGIRFSSPIINAATVTYITPRPIPFDPNTPQTKSFADRAALVVFIALYGATQGYTYFAAGEKYYTMPVDHALYGTDPISDLPGLATGNVISAGQFPPNANGAVTINSAITYADALGGGDVWIYGNWNVQPTGTWQTDNGDDNACVRVETTNPVRLRGVRGWSFITQTGTRIAHTVKFGGRVDTPDTATLCGMDGIIVEGNRTTAVSEAVPFEGGYGIYVSTPATPTVSAGVSLTNFEVRDTWAYGVGFQRAAWSNCIVADFVIEDTGNDGMDCKFDWPAATGAGQNWIRNGVIRRSALRQSVLSAQKAALDLRTGWNVSNIYIETTMPIVGLRFQNHDITVNADDPALVAFRMQAMSCTVIQSGTISGTDGDAASINAVGIQYGSDLVQAVNMNTHGGHTGHRIRCDGGSFTNLIGRDATATNLAIIATASGTADGNKIFGGEFTGGVTADVTISSSDATPIVGTSFHGVDCGVMTISADGSKTSIFGGTQTTFTDSGTETLRLSASHIGAFRAGRSNTQYVETTGDGSANRLTSVGTGKPLVISGPHDVDVGAAAGQSVSLKIDGVAELAVTAGGISMPAGNTMSINGNRVVTSRQGGWSVATGTATRTTFDTTTVTLPELAQRVKALIDDLHATAGHGLIGS